MPDFIAAKLIWFTVLVNTGIFYIKRTVFILKYCIQARK